MKNILAGNKIAAKLTLSLLKRRQCMAYYVNCLNICSVRFLFIVVNTFVFETVSLYIIFIIYELRVQIVQKNNVESCAPPPTGINERYKPEFFTFINLNRFRLCTVTYTYTLNKIFK